MWYKISQKCVKRLPHEDQETKPANKTDVDCSSSSRGLFLGIIVLVAIVITAITFFVLVQTSAYTTHALQLEHTSDLIIYAIMTTSAILAYYRMLVLRYCYLGRCFEHVLLFVSLIAVFIVCICNIVAGGFYTDSQHGLLLGLANLMLIIQAAVQFTFLISAAKRTAKTREQERDKPGREFVTFLLICNIGVWGLNVFIFQRWSEHGIQRLFYGDVGWHVIEHITEPFLLFFRFLSTVLLVSVWMHSWKMTSSLDSFRN